MTARTDGSQPDRHWLARQVLEGLLSSIRFGSQGPARWDAAEPYLLRQAIAHAVDAGQVDELLSDLEFLVHADPETLLPELRRANTPRTRLLAAMYRASSRFHELAAPAVRRQLLSLDAARYQVHDVAARLASPEGIPLSQFAPVWCTSAQVDAALMSTVQEETWIRSIALDTLSAREVAVAGGDDGSVRVYDLATAEPLGLPLTGPTDVIRSVTTGVRNERQIVLAAGDDRAMHIWDLASGEPVRLGKDRQSQIVASGRPIEAIAFTDLNTMPVAITGGGDRIIRVWDVMTGDLVRELRGHRNSVTSLACGALDDEPIVVSGGQDGTIRAWRLADGSEIARLSGSDTWVHSVAVAAVGESVLAIAGGSDSVVRVWDLRDGHPITNLRGHSGSISSVAPIRIGDHMFVASADSDGAVYLWDLADYDRAPQIITGHTKPVSALATGLFEARPVALSGGGDGTIRMWDLTAVISRDGDQDAYHASDVSALAFTTVDDQLMLLSGGEDGTIRLWDARAGSAVSAFHVPARQPALPEELTPGYGGTEVHALATAVIDGYPCLVAGAGQSRLLLRYLPSSDDSVLELDGHEDVVSAVATVETGDRVMAVSGGDDSLLRVWDLRTRRLLYPPLEGHDGWINAIDARLLEGRPVAASGGDDGTVRIWDLSDGRQLGPALRDGTDSINAVLLVTLDGSPAVIAAGDDAHIRVWDLASGRVTKVMAGHVQPVLALATAPGPGSLLVSGGKDAVLRFWDLASGRQTSAYHMPGEIPAITVAPDSTIMVAFGWEVAAFRPAAERLRQEDPQKRNELPFEQSLSQRPNSSNAGEKGAPVTWLPQRPNPTIAGEKDTAAAWRKAGLSAAFGVLAVILGGAAATTWLVELAPGATSPVWPAWTLTVLTVAAVYLSFASLDRRWPVRRDAKHGGSASVDLIPELVGDHLLLGLVNQGPAAEFSAQVTSILDPVRRREAPQHWTIPWLEDNSAEPKRILAGGRQVLDFARYEAEAVNAKLGAGIDGPEHWWFSAVPTPIGARYYNLRSQNDLELQRFILNVRVMNASSGEYIDWELTVRVQDRSLVCEVVLTGTSD